MSGRRPGGVDLALTRVYSHPSWPYHGRRGEWARQIRVARAYGAYLRRSRDRWRRR